MPRRILIVEDELIVAEDLAWQLTRIGYDVTGIAVSAHEAMEAVDREQPDIVLVDIQLQGAMNGIEIAQLIQRRTGAAIIFITAFPAVLLRDPEKMRPPGICLGKPFSMVQLKAALESIEVSPND